MLVSWTPDPASDGVSGYTVAASVTSGYKGPVPSGCASPSPVTAPGTDSSVLVGSLCARVPYTMTVSATNSAGTGPASASSNPATPLVAQPPSPPLILRVLARNHSLVVSWSAPTIDGGDALTGYTLTAKAGSTKVTTHATASATQGTIKGLVNGTQYAVSLTAASAAGASTAGTATGVPSTAYRPTAPQSVQVVPSGSGTLVARWSAPVDDGGDPILGYVITYQQQAPTSKGGWTPVGKVHTLRVGATTTNTTISGLKASDFYSVAVAARSKVGTGAPGQTKSPITPTVRLASKTVALTAPTMNALGSDQGGVLTWSAPAPAQVKSLATGDVIVGPTSQAAPAGLLAKVTSVHVDGSGSYTVDTKTATLSDAFKDVTLTQRGDSSSAAPAFMPAVAGVRVVASHGTMQRGGISISPTLTLAINLKDGASSLSGSISLNPDFEFSAQITQGFLGIPDGVSVASSLKLTGKIGATLTVSGSHKWQIGSIPLPSIEVPVGPVPLVLEPKIPVYLVVSGSTSVGFTASVTVGAGMSWSTADPGTLKTQNLSKPFALTAGPVPGGSLSQSAALTVKAIPELEIYGISGPNVEADAQLQVTINYKPTAGTPFLKIAPSIALKAGWNIDFSLGPLKFQASLSVNLATLTFPSFTIENVPQPELIIGPPNPTVQPGQALTFTATRTDGQAYPIKRWTLAGGVSGDSLSSAGKLNVVDPVGRTVTVMAVDTNGASGQTTVQVGSPFDPVSHLSAAQDPHDLGVAVAWQPPAKTGGSPIAKYTVTVSNGGPTLSTTSNTAAIPPLTPGTTYVITVYPTNTGGETGPIATAIVEVGPRVPSPGSSSALSGVACTSVSDCWAVGSYQDSNGTSFNETLHWNGSAWSLGSTPQPGTHGNNLDAISCTSASNCWAVGGQYVTPCGYGCSPSNEALHWNGTKWSLVTTPVGTGSDGSYLSGVSCTSASDCWAVGFQLSGTPYSPDSSETLHWNGTKWSLSTPTGNGLSGVVCTSASNCWAVGSSGQAQSPSANEALRWNGSKWAKVSTPNPSGDSNDLGGVACTSAVTCWAVGSSYNANTDSYASEVMEWDGSKWSLASTPQPGGAFLSGVSCTSASNCWAVGAQGGFSSNEALHWDGSTWSLVSTPQPGGATLSGVFCTSNSDCWAVGDQGSYPNSSNEALHWDGTEWSSE